MDTTDSVANGWSAVFETIEQCSTESKVIGRVLVTVLLTARTSKCGCYKAGRTKHKKHNKRT
jgi:hypothetical protein